MGMIVNRECNDMYNIDHVTNIYIGSDGCTIKAAAGASTRGGILGKYNSYEESKTAFMIMSERIAKGMPLIKMPGDAEVKERIKSEPKDSYHHITGKKTKGHGGS